MLNKAADQICALLAKMLTHVRTGKASTKSMRAMLEASKAINAQLAALQTATAAAVARREGHQDGGAHTLRASTGVSARQARRDLDTAESLGRVPAVREAVEEGEITFANAAALAEASRKTTPEAVQADPELLAQAREMPQDAFAKRARRWAARRQRDRGEADYRRLRARRSLRFWNGDDGMTHLRGVFDPVAGERIRNRLEHIAARLRRQDRRQPENSSNSRSGSRFSLSAAGGSKPAADTRGQRRPNRSGPGPGNLDSDRRGFEQCTADALEQLITTSPRTVDSNSSGSNSNSNPNGSNSSPGTVDSNSSGSNSNSNPNGSNSSPGTVDSNSSGSGCGCGGGILPQPVADILVYADIAALQPASPNTDNSSRSPSPSIGGGFAAEIAGGGPIPPSVLERLMCHARVTGLLFNGPGQPLCGAAGPAGPPPRRSSERCVCATGAASAAEPTPADAKHTTSTPGIWADPQTSTTWSWSATNATTESTTTAGTSPQPPTSHTRCCPRRSHSRHNPRATPHSRNPTPAPRHAHAKRHQPPRSTPSTYDTAPRNPDPPRAGATPRQNPPPALLNSIRPVCHSRQDGDPIKAGNTTGTVRPSPGPGWRPFQPAPSA